MGKWCHPPAVEGIEAQTPKGLSLEVLYCKYNGRNTKDRNQMAGQQKTRRGGRSWVNAVQLTNLWKLPPAHNGCGLASVRLLRLRATSAAAKFQAPAEGYTSAYQYEHRQRSAAGSRLQQQAWRNFLETWLDNWKRYPQRTGLRMERGLGEVAFL